MILERIDTINHLNEELRNSQERYVDLLNKTSVESSNQLETQQKLTNITQDKEKLEHQCQELQVYQLEFVFIFINKPSLINTIYALHIFSMI